MSDIRERLQDRIEVESHMQITAPQKQRLGVMRDALAEMARLQSALDAANADLASLRCPNCDHLRLQLGELRADNERLRESLRWTNEPPKTEGWYVCHSGLLDATHLCWIVPANGMRGWDLWLAIPPIAEVKTP